MAYVEMVETDCWCGMPFSMPARLYAECKKSGQTFYCPLGHSISFKNPEDEKIRRERDRLKQQIAQKDSEIRTWTATANDQKKKAEAARRETAKLKKRVATGTCPCCGRTFQNLRRHMKAKHPDMVNAKEVAKVHRKITKRGENVVELKQA